MKIAFLIDPLADLKDPIKLKLGQFEYTLVSTNSAEEIDQAGKQAGQVMICFTDSKLAYNFLKNNHWPFKTLNVLFLKGKPIISGDAAKKIKEIQLELVVMNDEEKLKKIITDFENSKDITEDIEFSYKS